MVFNVSLCIKIALCLAMIIQFASQNHHEKAIQVELFLIASSAILLWGRYLNQRKRRGFGLHITYPLLIPLAIGFVCTYFINNLGGLGGFAD